MKFVTIFNEEIDVDCLGCINSDFSKFKAGRIYDSKLWSVTQDFEIAYPGMIVIGAMRHVSEYSSLTFEELEELHRLIVRVKQALKDIFGCDRFGCMFFERNNGHFHFIIIPFHGLIKVNNKYSAVAELLSRKDELMTDDENMKKVVETINKIKPYFS